MPSTNLDTLGDLCPLVPQVHEKSLLLPLLPLTLLAGKQPGVVTWLNLVGTLSMFPLLKKDGLAQAYVATGALFWAVMQVARGSGASNAANKGNMRPRPAVRVLVSVSAALACALHVTAAALAPPAQYPFLFDAAFVTYSFVHLVALFAWLHREQLLEYSAAGPKRAGACKAKAV